MSKSLSKAYSWREPSELDEVSEDFPEDFFKMKILPELLKSVEFGGGGPKVFSFIMKIGAKLPDDEFETRLNPAIARLFASPDRQIRVCLLDNLPRMIDHFSSKMVNDKIFPQLVSCPSILSSTFHLSVLGYWLHRLGSCRSRTNCQSGINDHNETLWSYH